MGWIDNAKETLKKALGTKKSYRRKFDSEDGKLRVNDVESFLARIDDSIDLIYDGTTPQEYFLQIQKAALAQLAKASSESVRDDASLYDIEKYGQRADMLESKYLSIINHLYTTKNFHSTFTSQIFKILVRGESTESDMLVYIGAYNLAKEGYDIYVPVIFVSANTIFTFLYQFYNRPSNILYGQNYVGNNMELSTIRRTEKDVKYKHKIQHEVVLEYHEISPKNFNKGICRYEIFPSGKSKSFILQYEDAKNHFLRAYRLLRMAGFINTAYHEPFFTVLDLVEQILLPQQTRTILERVPILDEL